MAFSWKNLNFIELFYRIFLNFFEFCGIFSNFKILKFFEFFLSKIFLFDSFFLVMVFGVIENAVSWLKSWLGRLNMDYETFTWESAWPEFFFLSEVYSKLTISKSLHSALPMQIQ